MTIKGNVGTKRVPTIVELILLGCAKSTSRVVEFFYASNRLNMYLIFGII